MCISNGIMCFLLCCISEVLSSDLHTSTAQIQRLLDNERILLEFLEKYFENLAKKNSTYESFVWDVKNDISAIEMTASAGHPLDCVIGIWRYHSYTRRYLAFLPSDLKRKVEEAHEDAALSLPSNRTVLDAQHGLFRLQSTYKVTSCSLVTSSNVDVTSQQCGVLASVAKRVGLDNIAKQWSDLAVRLRNKKNIGSKGTFIPCTETKTDHEESNWETSGGDVVDQLCYKFRDISTLGSRSGVLRCLYETGRSLLVRWKAELLSVDPRIVLYHDVIADAETDAFIQFGGRTLERAVTGDTPGMSSPHQARTSQVAWLWDNQTATARTVSRRVQDITGLHTSFRDMATFAEPFQVVNYGIGGHYAPHYDYYVNQESVKESRGSTRGSGDRMATFLIYLSNVTSGGATVFPELGVGSPPIKNAALYWHNFHRNGSPDDRTLHAGCPVLFGHKWVANKWIRQISGSMTLSCEEGSP